MHYLIFRGASAFWETAKYLILNFGNGLKVRLGCATSFINYEVGIGSRLKMNFFLRLVCFLGNRTVPDP
jgi:hypothetical protein